MAQLVKVAIAGTLPGGEEWSVNPCYTISDFGVATTPAEVQAAATACGGVAVPANLLAIASTSTNFTSVRVEARMATGTLENLAEAPITGTPNGGGTNSHPFQVAWVSSLRTAQVGARGRGRLFWPATGVALTSSALRPSTATTSNFATAVAEYLQGIQTALRTVWAEADLIVWSRATGGMFAVSRIQAGDVLDTQRRRRDVLVEAYQSVVY